MAIFFLDIQIKVIAIKCTGSYIYILLLSVYMMPVTLFNIFYVINIELAVALIEWPKTI